MVVPIISAPGWNRNAAVTYSLKKWMKSSAKQENKAGFRIGMMIRVTVVHQSAPEMRAPRSSLPDLGQGRRDGAETDRNVAQDEGDDEDPDRTAHRVKPGQPHHA